MLNETYDCTRALYQTTTTVTASREPTVFLL